MSPLPKMSIIVTKKSCILPEGGKTAVYLTGFLFITGFYGWLRLLTGGHLTDHSPNTVHQNHSNL